MVQRPSGNQSMQHANIVPSSLVKSSWVLGKIYPIIPGRLSFTAHHDDDHTNEQISRNIHMFYFSSDFHEHYEPYCADFGPVNLSGNNENKHIKFFFDFINQYSIPCWLPINFFSLPFS